MAGNYCIQFHDKNGVLPMRETVFEGFNPLLEWLKTYDKTKSKDAINVHLPSCATDGERQSVRDLGFVPN